MRKLLILFISMIMLLCLSTVTSAQERNQKISTREEALNHAVQLFPEIISDKENLLRVDFRNDQYLGRDMWEITYDRYEPGPYRLRICFDAVTGQLFDFSYRPEKYPDKTQVLNRDEAKQIAIAFIKKHHPDKLNMITERERQHITHYGGNIELAYYFGWHQLVDGKPFDVNMISVGVNAISGEVTQFNCNWWDNIEISNYKAIDIDTFTNQVVNKLGLYPCYITNPGSANSGARLVYKLNTSYSQFDANNGNPVDYQGKETSIENARMFTQQFTPATATETKLDRQLEQELIDPNKMSQIAKSFFQKIGVEGNVIRSGSGRSGGPGYSMEYWNYSIERDNTAYGYNEIEAGINIRTGEIVNYRNPRAESHDTTGDGVTRDKALATATEFMSAINPGNSNNMALRDESAYYSDEPVFNFNWVRLVNGVPLVDNSVLVTVDRYTGKVIDYRNRQQPVKSFAGTENIISPDQALETFIKARPFVLKYSYRSDSKEPNEKARLVYANEYGLAVDALTGKIIRTYGENPDPGAYDNKIKNHWARLPLTLLADSGLLPEPEAFEPNESVTRRDGLRVLGAVPADYYYGDATGSPFSDIANDDDDLEAILRAVQLNIVEAGGTLRPDAPLTREDLAVWLVNMLGHKDIAQAQGLSIDLDYKDARQISNSKRNYVAIATGLNLIGQDTNGNFRPQAPVTWGELASVVVKVAPRLAR